MKRDGSLRVEGRKEGGRKESGKREREKGEGDEVYRNKQIGAPAMAVLPNTRHISRL